MTRTDPRRISRRGPALVALLLVALVCGVGVQAWHPARAHAMDGLCHAGGVSCDDDGGDSTGFGGNGDYDDGSGWVDGGGYGDGGYGDTGSGGYGDPGDGGYGDAGDGGYGDPGDGDYGDGGFDDPGDGDYGDEDWGDDPGSGGYGDPGSGDEMSDGIPDTAPEASDPGDLPDPFDRSRDDSQDPDHYLDPSQVPPAPGALPPGSPCQAESISYHTIRTEGPEKAQAWDLYFKCMEGAGTPITTARVDTPAPGAPTVGAGLLRSAAARLSASKAPRPAAVRPTAHVRPADAARGGHAAPSAAPKAAPKHAAKRAKPRRPRRHAAPKRRTAHRPRR
jgi:hypothetical protein